MNRWQLLNYSELACLVSKIRGFTSPSCLFRAFAMHLCSSLVLYVLVILSFITFKPPKSFVYSIRYKCPHCVIFSIALLLDLRPRYSHQQRILRSSRSMIFPQFERQNFDFHMKQRAKWIICCLHMLQYRFGLITFSEPFIMLHSKLDSWFNEVYK